MEPRLGCCSDIQLDSLLCPVGCVDNGYITGAWRQSGLILGVNSEGSVISQFRFSMFSSLKGESRTSLAEFVLKSKCQCQAVNSSRLSYLLSLVVFD